MTQEAMFGCIVCGRTLENVQDGSENQPYAGTVFTSEGHYGSTFFDPMGDGQELVVNICDPCLDEAKERGVLGWRIAFNRLKHGSFEVGRQYTDNPTVPYSGQDTIGATYVATEELGTTLDRRTLWWPAGVDAARREAEAEEK